MDKKESKKNQAMESFLTSNLVEEDQVQKFSDEYTIINKYPLLPPFSYATILYNEAKADVIYHVSELKLTQIEQKICENLNALIEESLESTEIISSTSNFDSFLDNIIKKHEKMFSSNSFSSLQKVKYYLSRDIAGFGLIDPLMHDVNIEDVSCSGVGEPIYIWHRNFDSIKTNIKFDTHENLNSFVSRIVFRSGKHISSAHPITDLALKGGHRLSVLYQKEVTPKGTSFTIRKFREDPYSIIDLINFGTLDVQIVAYIWMLIESKSSFVIIGSTGSGKTTILNACAGLMNPDYKIFTVEDVAEINISHKNWFSLVSRTGFGSKGEGDISLFELVKAGMRHRPDYIVIGEIRGSEAYVLFQAMATGHGGISTIHADSVESAIKRLQQKPMEIPASYIPLINCAVVIKRIKDRSTNRTTRKAVMVSEISNDKIFNHVFQWNPKSDNFDGDLSQSLLFKKIADSTGQELNNILEEYQKRKMVIQWMVENNVHTYVKVAEVVGKYYRDSHALMQTIS